MYAINEAFQGDDEQSLIIKFRIHEISQDWGLAQDGEMPAAVEEVSHSNGGGNPPKQE